MTKIDIMFNNLSHEECKKIIEYCKDKTTRSWVVNKWDWKTIIWEWRTSKSYFIKNWEISEIDKLKNKLVKEYNINSNQVESFCFLKYDKDCEYRAHYDYFTPWKPSYDVHIKRGWNRIMTFLTYLNDDFEGSWTSFPKLNFSLKPNTGTTIIFRSFNDKNELDKNTIHSWDKIIKWTKYVVVTFVREWEFK